MRKACFLIFTVLLLFTLAQIASAQGSLWSERQLTSGFSQWRGSPRVWQDKVYYGDMGATSISKVYRWTEAQGSVVVLGGDGVSRAPVSVWENNIVMSRVVSGQHKLYLYDGTSEMPIATSAGTKENADIYGSTAPTVVWEDHRNPDLSQIYIWDEVHGERILSPTSYNQRDPKIWGDRVVWQEDNPGGTEFKIYSYTPSEGRRFIGYGVSPGIWQDRVVGWKRAYYDKSDPYNWVFVPGSLWQWTPTGGEITLAEHNWTTGIEYTDMWGTLVVANYGRAWDPVNGFTYNAVNYPSIYENNVAGVRSNNIYLETLVPEPSGLLALSSLAGALLLFKPKKRRNR